MKSKKKLVSAALVTTLLLAATGCSPNQSRIFQASMNLQQANSLREHMTMAFQASGTSFSSSDQPQVDKMVALLNNAKLDFDIKSNRNQQKTLSSAEIDMNLGLQGMNVDVPVWVDSDLTGKTPDITEIVKVPSVAAASLPPQFANKQYMLLKPHNTAFGNADAAALVNFNQNLQAATTAFLTSYAQQFNPGFDALDQGTQNIQTGNGTVSAQIYEIKLNDTQFKNFIRYAVNNFVQSDTAISYVKELLDSSLQFSQTPDKDKVISQLDQAFAQFKANRPAFLSQFNAVMDKLQNVTILGDKGIDIHYDIADGYVVKENGTVDLKLDLSQFSQFVNTLDPAPKAQGQQNTVAPAAAKGTLNLTINFTTDISNINNQPKIKMPQVDSSNSFNYQDLSNDLPGNTKLESTK